MAYIEHQGYEDNYTAYEFEDFAHLMAQVLALCTDDLYGSWNVPVWINSNENGLHLGLLLTRHGLAVQWFVRDYTSADVAVFEATMLNIWAGRAEHHFARHTYAQL